MDRQSMFGVHFGVNLTVSQLTLNIFLLFSFSFFEQDCFSSWNDPWLVFFLSYWQIQACQCLVWKIVHLRSVGVLDKFEPYIQTRKVIICLCVAEITQQIKRNIMVTNSFGILSSPYSLLGALVASDRICLYCIAAKSELIS